MELLVKASMIDINFYMSVFNLKYRLMKGEEFERGYIFDKLEEFRSPEPVLYNIETTNACNMRCEMCPRTTLMVRDIEALDTPTFTRIAEQLKPFSDEQWERWQLFVEKNYRVPRGDMSENHFFLHVIPKVVVLHGYGDPLLDKYMQERVGMLSERAIPSYFSCNPANINIDRTMEIFSSGLGYIKFSIESVDDLRHKEVRGAKSDFTGSYRNILKLLDLKAKRGLKTTVVITMLDLNKESQGDEFEKLKEAFKGMDVYVYLKSQDQKWYKGNEEKTESIHWTEFCQFPWSSMTVKSNGEVVMCVEDYNNEIILGDAGKESLYDIWNGERYKKFRADHFDLTPGIKCTGQCDMSLIGDMKLLSEAPSSRARL